MATIEQAKQMNSGLGIPMASVHKEVESIPELSRSLEDLNQVICRYDRLVGELSAKLDPVLRPGSPECQSNEKDSGYSTQMAQRINSMRATTRDITNCLESIIERIEL